MAKKKPPSDHDAFVDMLDRAEIRYSERSYSNVTTVTVQYVDLGFDPTDGHLVTFTNNELD